MKLKNFFLSLCVVYASSLFISDRASAQEAMIAEIRIFAGNFAPRGWAFCDGSLLSIAQNTALFSLIGTTYGGNGTTNFALPDLRGRVPVGLGTGPGLSLWNLGQVRGATNVTQTSSAHQHVLTASKLKDGVANNSTDPGAKPRILMANVAPAETDVPLATAVTGSNTVVDNHQPSIGINYIIATQGIFPSRP